MKPSKWAMLRAEAVVRGCEHMVDDRATCETCIALELDAVVARERELCAKVCDARVMGDNNREDQEARRCAAAIRKEDQ